MQRRESLRAVDPSSGSHTGSREVGLTVLPVTNSMIPAMYWQMPPKNIMVVMMMLGASTPRVPIPVRDTRKTLVAKERRPSGAGFAKRRWYIGIPGWLLSSVRWASRRAELRMSSFSVHEEDMLCV